MGTWPHPRPGNAVYGNVAAGGSTSVGAQVTANSTNSEGSYVTLVTSAPYETAWWWLKFGDFTGTAPVDALIDVAVGASGQEQPWIDNLLTSVAGSKPMYDFQFLGPLRVPLAQTVRARGQTDDSAIFTVLQYLAFGVTFGPPARQAVASAGPNPADSGGTQLDPGGTANTKGAWSELSAAAPGGEWLVIAWGNLDDARASTATWLVDIGIGAAGSEVVLVADLPVRSSGGFQGLVTPPLAIPVAVPAGQRLAVRGQCSITDATDRLIDVAVYLFR